MESPQYLIDTNAIIDFLGKKFPESGMLYMSNVIDAVPNISIITKIEVLGFNAPADSYRVLVDFMNDAVILDLTSAIVNACIEIKKKKKIKLPDAVIAATTVVYGFKLISRNVSDFKGVSGIEVINPYDL